jgi:hypothetical protein
MAQPAAEVAEVTSAPSNRNASGHGVRFVTDLCGVPTNHLGAEATQVVPANLLPRPRVGLRPDHPDAIVHATHEVLAVAVGLTTTPSAIHIPSTLPKNRPHWSNTST